MPRLVASDPLPLLVTGITGVVGYQALPHFQAAYPGQVIGIRQAGDPRLAGPGIVACNAEDRRGLASLFDRYRFRSVLNCAGNCALKSCELAPAMARRINVEGVANLLEQTRRTGARLVHLSVDMVFSGLRNGGYREDHPPDPVSIYGKTMLEAERLVAAGDPAACVLRISLPMGRSLSGHAGAIDWIVSRFAKGRPATLYFDEVRTPTYTDCLNRVCEAVLGSTLAGLYHAGAPRRLTLYQIGQIINRVGGYRPDCLRGIPRIEAGPIPPRAGNVAMNSDRLAAALGYEPFDPWPLDEALVPTDRDWHRRRGHGEHGSPERLHELLALNARRRRCA